MLTRHFLRTSYVYSITNAVSLRRGSDISGNSCHFIVVKSNKKPRPVHLLSIKPPTTYAVRRDGDTVAEKECQFLIGISRLTMPVSSTFGTTTGTNFSGEFGMYRSTVGLQGSFALLSL
mmetsp:Transcript_29337/g.49989  ORF Transcript_29337/g.49989 Transcript_29337/m.49989 type:complete len:119 (-) Transcript_29337:1826-2182(-)